MEADILIKIRQHGNFAKLSKYLADTDQKISLDFLESYAAKGVAALAAATPVDSGKTAESWYYKIDRRGSHIRIGFYNSNINKGVNIAIILQLGHGTRNGGWVEGRDYINPALQPIFDEMAEAAWKEVGGK